MCLIAFNWQPQAALKLVIAANRDEFYARPTLPLHRWSEQPIVAGKDLQAGGTWLGVSTSGRVAALTNYRDMGLQRADAPSRGSIATAFLMGTASADAYLAELERHAPGFNAFNLLLFDGDNLLGFESRHQRTVRFESGTYAVSNADFNTPWPKLNRLRGAVDAALLERRAQGDDYCDTSLQSTLFALLAQRQTAPDAQLPATGIPLDRERALSSEFIQTPDYGTRCSTVLSIGADHAELAERSFDAKGYLGEVQETIVLGSTP